MLNSSGKGPVVLLVSGLCGALTQFIFEKITGDPEFMDNSSWGIPLALILSGIVNIIIGSRLSRDKGKFYIDKDTGLEVFYRQEHKLLNMGITTWGVIFISFALLVLFVEAIR
ncbi:hypothetical protein [Rubeoparvulum massiliense]|uniref:hypothetical protein n=1 Tax=Rubeoparvulum massiliense TaxID=1631346 RepID=UPI00065DC949|nr:hypothetical protein [Rubeoparvulum massiliense]